MVRTGALTHVGIVAEPDDLHQIRPPERKQQGEESDDMRFSLLRRLSAARRQNMEDGDDCANEARMPKNRLPPPCAFLPDSSVGVSSLRGLLSAITFCGADAPIWEPL